MNDFARKLNRIGIRLVIALALIVGVVGYLWVFVLGGRSLFPDSSASVDGEVTYSYDSQVEEALKRLHEGCGQAGIVRTDSQQDEKSISIAFVGFSTPSVNEGILELLGDYDYQSTFFVSGVEAGDYEDLIHDIESKGHDIGSRGLNGEGRAETKSQEALVDELVRSNEAISHVSSTYSGQLFCPDTLYTDNVLEAAMASGSDRVIDPDAACVLDYRSFESESEVVDFVSGLQAGTLLAIVTDGIYEETPSEPRVTPDVPAKDKQASEEPVEEEEKPENALELTRWLFKAMSDQGFYTVPVDDLAAMSDETPEAEPAIMYRSFLTDKSNVGLALWGIPESDSLDNVLDLLARYGAHATFFVTEDELTTKSKEIASIMTAGHTIGNGGSGDSDHTEEREVYNDLLSCESLIERISNEKLMAFLPIGQLPLGKSYEEQDLRSAAGDAGYVIINPAHPKEINKGSLYGFDLTDGGSLTELEAMLIEADKTGYSVYDIAEMLDEPAAIDPLSADEVDGLQEANGEIHAAVVDNVLTTQPALSLIFYGVRCHPAVYDVIDRLGKRDAHATFFVTFDDMQSCSDVIERLLAEGHQLAVAYVSSDDYPATFDGIVRYLHSCSEYMKWRFDMEPSLLLLPFESAQDKVLEAASASNFDVVSAGFYITRSDDKEITVSEASSAVDRAMSKSYITKGSLTYFNLNYYQSDQNLPSTYKGDTVGGAVVDAFISNCVDAIAYRDPETGEIEDGSRYAMVTCKELLSSPQRYTLPDMREQSDISTDKHVLSDQGGSAEQFNYMCSRYIGTPSADTELELPGFSQEEVVKLDKDGRITDKKLLFLTFDDWGTDAAINKLLYVLDKHDVKATFFVRANFVNYSPNLLRSIAEAGHEIASHSFNHLALADYDEATGQYLSLNPQEIATLREDLAKSYETLYYYIGDVEVNGVKALSKNFRPPTLAVSKEGLSQVFDVGFHNVVSGEFSTHDYEATSVQQLVEQFESGIISGDVLYPITNGSCIVMHMSDESKFTAQALDVMIPRWKEQGYQFARVDTYLP